ncbi:hypothetical protein K144313037_22820 [Clostridium tetani]|nr:DUF6514 family protein [Clostridium tetani]KGI36756.1 hypothetical protein LA33_13015 [Clostridium tetani ATCC 9441]KGI38669.1 hypothetical protein KY52_05905 [Clostridium tetani]KGI43278.1 hypothetical protein KY55_07485 [Clostridium tetani]KGI44088.1 hypothetical protein KY54_08495 [Clostridium tetani]KHO30987.1 hypothetical protein OR63_12730 [Clostridium tetani]
MVVVESLNKVCREGELEHNYSYRMTKGKISLSGYENPIELQSYGIEIERQDIVKGDIINIERDFVKDISCQRYKVHKLLRLLYDNSVSPIHLIDIIGEYIDKYIEDFDNQLKEIAIN